MKVSTKDVNFCTTVGNWIKQNGEISCLIRYSHAAGKKSFEFFQSLDDFSRRLGNLSSKTSITIFLNRQLPLRGQVNSQFIKMVLEQIPEKSEYIITGLSETVMGERRWFRFDSGEGHASLASDLEEFQGQNVAVGEYPPWLNVGEKVISAIVPESDGSIIVGIY